MFVSACFDAAAASGSASPPSFEASARALFRAFGAALESAKLIGIDTVFYVHLYLSDMKVRICNLT